MSKSIRFVSAVLQSPFLWGILGSVGFYALVYGSPLGTPLVKRYFTHHPVEYMETILFSIGLAVLVVKAFEIAAQRAGLAGSLLGPAAKTLQPVEECRILLARLGRLPARRQNEYYISRLRRAMESICWHGSTNSLDDELKYLSDMDAARLHNGYALFRVIVWAIPILGFLGTVIGITMALNSVDLQAPDKSMADVLKGLGLKFDTTAVALALSMGLMFVHYFVERAETLLLEQVDRRVQSELFERFAASAATAVDAGDSSAVAQRVGEVILQATESLMRRQTELWQAAVESAAQQWSQMTETAGGHVKDAMAAAAGEFTERADVLGRAVEAAGEVARLEDALNRNLAALAGAKHFEQTVLSLAAAVNMLSARLAEPNAGANLPVRLESTRRSIHAA